MSRRPSTVAFFILFFFPIFPFLHISHLSVFFEQSRRSIALLRCPPAHAAPSLCLANSSALLHRSQEPGPLPSLQCAPQYFGGSTSHLTGTTGGGCISLILLPLLFVFFSPFSLVHHTVDYFVPNNFCHSNQYLL